MKRAPSGVFSGWGERTFQVGELCSEFVRGSKKVFWLQQWRAASLNSFTRVCLVAEESKRILLPAPGLLVPPENSLHDRREGKLGVFIDWMTVRLGKKEQPKDYLKISSLRDLGNGRLINRHREARRTELTSSHHHKYVLLQIQFRNVLKVYESHWKCEVIIVLRSRPQQAHC